MKPDTADLPAGEPELPIETAQREALRDALLGAFRRRVGGDDAARPPAALAAPPAAAPAEPEPKNNSLLPTPSTGSISFGAPMVRALLAGLKTQTRRPVRPPPARICAHNGATWPADADGQPLECSIARTGTVLWVREPWDFAGRSRRRFEYEADLGPAAAAERVWRMPRHMPRAASRFSLLVLSVEPQRLGAISPIDAAAEGMFPADAASFPDDAEPALEWFRQTWDGFFGRTPFAWKHDPWVWVIRFMPLESPRAAG